MANLSSGGNRAYSFQDIIKILNDSANQANSPDLNPNEVSDQIVVKSDKVTVIGTAPVLTANSSPAGFQYGNANYGEAKYAS